MCGAVSLTIGTDSVSHRVTLRSAWVVAANKVGRVCQLVGRRPVRGRSTFAIASAVSMQAGPHARMRAGSSSVLRLSDCSDYSARQPVACSTITARSVAGRRPAPPAVSTGLLHQDAWGL
jgi:hypothetical protein